MNVTKKAMENLINLVMMQYGCSRLIATGRVAHMIVDEYNAIQRNLGSTVQDCIVDKGWLEETIRQNP